MYRQISKKIYVKNKKPDCHLYVSPGGANYFNLILGIFFLYFDIN